MTVENLLCAVGTSLRPLAALSSSEMGLQTVRPESGVKPCCSSGTQSCLTLCDPVDCSMLGFPVLRHLPEFDSCPLNR